MNHLFKGLRRKYMFEFVMKKNLLQCPYQNCSEWFSFPSLDRCGYEAMVQIGGRTCQEFASEASPYEIWSRENVEIR